MMKKINLFVLFNIILFLSSCGSVKEGFSNQKKNNSDEFLVEKKSPLIMPPDYNELPIPVEKNREKKMGCTVHFVSSKLDSGKIILQNKVKISKNETPKTLSKKILIQEHKLYPKAILKVFSL